MMQTFAKTLPLRSLTVTLLLASLPGCAALRVASLAGKAGSAGSKVASVGKVATAAKVGVAAEGASAAARAAHGGEVAAAAARAEQAGAGAARAASAGEEAAQAGKAAAAGEEAAHGPKLGDIADAALEVADVGSPGEASPQPESDPNLRSWSLTQGRKVLVARAPGYFQVALVGFKPPAVPQVQLELKTPGAAPESFLTQPGELEHAFVLTQEGLPQGTVEMTLISGKQKVKLKPWKLP